MKPVAILECVFLGLLATAAILGDMLVFKLRRGWSRPYDNRRFGELP